MNSGDLSYTPTPPVENPRIAAFKAALAALTYSDMMGVAHNIQTTLPTPPVASHPMKAAAHDIAGALARYASGK